MSLIVLQSDKSPESLVPKSVSLSAPTDYVSSDDDAPQYSPMSWSYSFSDDEDKNTESPTNEHQGSDHDDESTKSPTCTDVEQETFTTTPDTSTDQPLSHKDQPLWSGYKIVGDNVDKNVKPRYERFEIKSQSLHYFHAYAARDRIDMTSLCDSQPATIQPDSNHLIPSSEDIRTIQDEMCILLSR